MVHERLVLPGPTANPPSQLLLSLQKLDDMIELVKFWEENCERSIGFGMDDEVEVVDAIDLLFFLEPPPTGTLLRDPPLVQYLLQPLQKPLSSIHEWVEKGKGLVLMSKLE
ncbi:hypothetical protein Ccrd_009004 [Cynara cardunculus var. scolymus]|uniref:Uncharacterized protein n=1 Tax=Cynara cardunculus var. scolymus TaxID=59895 RepID=A0A103XE50_CYNCS|nr:hypothetical protein Ccrd_009004 [Cynara cardunculus var. scolymus]